MKSEDESIKENRLDSIMENKSKNRIPQIAEAVFCILYLVFGFVSGFIFCGKCANNNKLILYTILTLVLVCGDSFHLIPRIINAFADKFEKYEFWAGLGLLISSISMTVFYFVLFYICQEISGNELNSSVVKCGLFVFGIIRIILCMFPQNNWFKSEGNIKWGIIRNIPFIVVGIIMIYVSAASGLINLAIAVFLSFAFYLPVVLFGKKNPKVGMLMIPKTLAYVYMISLGFTIL